MNSIIKRRTALLAALTFPLPSAAHSGAHSQPRQSAYFLHPFAGSRTVSAFACELLGLESLIPIALYRAIHIEFSRPVARMDSSEDERRRADFFAWFAIQTIAPRHLRRAGYDEQAAACESASDLGEGGHAAASAQECPFFDRARIAT